MDRQQQIEELQQRRLEISIWAINMTDLLSPMGLTKYHRGRRSAFAELLDQLDWPDKCEKCGSSPVVDRVEEMVMCADCITAWGQAIEETEARQESEGA
jgi:ribosomal protein L37AE/L43A